MMMVMVMVTMVMGIDASERRCLVFLVLAFELLIEEGQPDWSILHL
jgi:hypothetical protein